MKFAVEKFEQSAVYLALALVWAVSVFHPDVSVNENAITELVIILVAVLAGGSKITDVLYWFAVNRNFGEDVQYGLDLFEKESGVDIPDVLETVVVNVANEVDAELSNPKAA